MKRILLLFFSSSSLLCYSQKLISKADSLYTAIENIRNKNFVDVKSQAFDKLVDKDFKYLIGNTNRTNPYVSQVFVDITQPNININTQGIPINLKMIDKPSYLSFDVKAGISDGVSELFKNNKLNTGISGNMNWNILLFNRYFFIDEERKNKNLNDKKNDFINKLVWERNEKIYKYELAMSKIEKIKSEKDKIALELDTLEKKSEDYFKAQIKLHELRIESNKYEIMADSLYKSLDNDITWTKKVSEEVAKKVTEFEIENGVFSSKSLGWITGFLGLESIKYNIFYPDSAFNKQIAPSYFRGVNRGIRFNVLFLSSSNWWSNGFASIGYKKGLEDNIGSFSKWDATTKQDFKNQIGNAQTVRSLEQKGSVLLASPEILKSGGYITNQFNTLQLQFIKFLDFDRNLGLSMVYDRKFLKKDNNNINFQDIEFGLLFQGTDKKDDKVKYYVTLYLSFYDLMNTGQNKKEDGTLTKWQERNEIGLKLGIPFNTIKLKK